MSVALFFDPKGRPGLPGWNGRPRTFGAVTDQVKTRSVLISCAIDQLREHRDLLLVCRYAARALRGHCALKVDVIAITPNAAANSGREPSLSVNFI